MSAPVGGSSSSTTTTPRATGMQSLLDPQAFLELLVAELKNQDPTQPMDGKDMIAQLATLNQVQYAQQQVQTQQEAFASSLIGKDVTGTQKGKQVTGAVTAVNISGSTVNVMVNDEPMDVTTVVSVTPTSNSTSVNGGSPT
jgi:flagellar basal-body rod modification protein FlgD